jgi:hypothetical protein
MIRIKNRVKVEDFGIFLERIKNNSYCEQYMQFGFKQYRYNIHVKSWDKQEKEYSFWIGYQQNMEKPCNKYNFIIEYNPNKIPVYDAVFRYVICNIVNKDSEVVSCDIAMDLMNINIQNIVYEKGLKRKVMTFDMGEDDKTIYIGQGNGRVKIYNKAKEQKILDRNWTRYEVSLDIDIPIKYIEQYKLGMELPKVYCMESGQLNDDKTMTAIIYAVLNGYPVSDLSRAYRNKIKNLYSNNEVSINNNIIEKTLAQYVKSILTYV